MKKCVALHVHPDLPLYHIGPPLDLGPLPSFFYFALSGETSLTVDPYNQPVQFLNGEMIRIFSLTLPGHEHGLPAIHAMSYWAEQFAQGQNPLAAFLDQAQEAVAFAIREQFVDPAKLAIGGLSRGAFAAAHVAAADARFRFLLGFAPLTKLSAIKEFHHLASPLVNAADLIHLAPQLQDRHVRFYIGNADARVGTRNCFDFAMRLVEERTARTSQVELFITPSIGQAGHGTGPEIFNQGAQWIQNCLK